MWPRAVLLFLIRIYQKTFSPDHGFVRALFPYGYCKYRPTCSEYGYGVIEKYGLFKGITLTLWRILRCNPCSHGGEDPVQ